MQPAIMLFFTAAKDEYVIHMAQYPRQSSKDVVHLPLEVFWGTADTEG